MRRITILGVVFLLFSMLVFTSCPGPVGPGHSLNHSLYDGVIQWVWGTGSNTINQVGVYGTQGSFSASNTPGARMAAGAWAGKDGNLWLFGGFGYNKDGGSFNLNDLWKYNEATAQWSWISGVNENYQYGVYGARGLAASTNIPGGRYGMATWIDSEGDLWLFGGWGLDSDTSNPYGNYLNDLWKFDVSTGLWTWMAGATTGLAPGVYGALGQEDSDNVPSARRHPTSWVDTDDNLWLFGGHGCDSTGGNSFHTRALNDLWKYSISTGKWTWVSGASTVCHPGVYGTRGTAAVTNVPGSREGAVSWIDASGNLWLFGGYGYDKDMADIDRPGHLNDLWKFNVTTSQWTWITGSNTLNQHGVYGTIYQAAAINTPGGRMGSAAWFDAEGFLWLFGGQGYDKNDTSYVGMLNDLWRFDLTTSQWAWVTGSNLMEQTGTYGTRGLLAKTNTPGGRIWPAYWTNYKGSFLLFGGEGMGNAVSQGKLNDMWGTSLTYVVVN